MKIKPSLLSFCFFLFSSPLLISCSDTFQPLQENGKFNFSIYGYLDASADTQWIRVGEIRDHINGLPDPSGILVTLEHVQSQTTVAMNDSLFTSRDALNYWTTFDIENDQTYRIKVERPDGKFSQVTVSTPKDFPTPIVVNTGPPLGSDIFIDASVKHIADFQSKWYVIYNPETNKLRRTISFSYKNKVKPTGAPEGGYRVYVPRSDESGPVLRDGSAQVQVVHQQFFIAVAGPEWNEGLLSVDDLEYFLPATYSNIENGVGYVVGITSKWIPQYGCFTDERKIIRIPCADEGPFW